MNHFWNKITIRIGGMTDMTASANTRLYAGGERLRRH